MSAKPDLAQFTDEEVFRICSEDVPHFTEVLSLHIGDGLSDDEIVRRVAVAGGDGQLMHVTKKCLRFLRSQKPA